MNHHLTLEEKIDLLQNTTGLDNVQSFELAQIFDDCPFGILKEISKAVKIMSKGHDK